MKSMNVTLACLGSLGLVLACSSESSGRKTPMSGNPVASPTSGQPSSSADTNRNQGNTTPQTQGSVTPDVVPSAVASVAGSPGGFTPPNTVASVAGGTGTNTGGTNTGGTNTGGTQNPPVTASPTTTGGTTTLPPNSDACVASASIDVRYIKKPVPMYEYQRKDSRVLVANIPAGNGTAAVEVEWFGKLAKNGFVCVRLKSGGREVGWVNAADANLGSAP